jgi:hypothetical protein
VFRRQKSIKYNWKKVCTRNYFPNLYCVFHTEEEKRLSEQAGTRIFRTKVVNFFATSRSIENIKMLVTSESNVSVISKIVFNR